MIKLHLPAILLSLCVFMHCFTSMAIAQQNEPGSKDTLRVGIAGSAPFVIIEEDDYQGISLEIWDAIASKAGWNYTLAPFDNVSMGLDALTEKNIDLMVGPTSITAERTSFLQFSQPYYQSSLSILSRTEAPSLWDRISPFFSITLLYALFIFLFILAFVGMLLWFAEKKASPEQFPPNPVRGIANGMWCAIVTMSTTGYGDIAPVTLMGRIVAGSWMVISIIFATSMVAGIASTLTLTAMKHSVIAEADDLKERRIGVLEGSPAVEFVEDYGGTEIPFQNLEEGYELLKSKKVDAIVFDRPQMLYFLKNNPDKSVSVAPAEYSKLGYGFAFPADSKKVKEVNILLLRLAEDGKLNRITQYWLGEKSQ